MIVVDTREKANQRIIEYFEKRDIPYIRKKLETGDYMESSNPHLVVERKKDLDELMHNLCSSDRTRFWNEIRRAKENNIRMIVLCEHGGQYKSIKDVRNFRSKYSRISGKVLMDRMYAVHIGYGVEFLFCDKRCTGKRIVELLNDKR